MVSGRLALVRNTDRSLRQDTDNAYLWSTKVIAKNAASSQQSSSLLSSSVYNGVSGACRSSAARFNT